MEGNQARLVAARREQGSFLRVDERGAVLESL